MNAFLIIVITPMKSDVDLKQQLYTDQIIPIYLLQDKLKANFVSIQRRFKQVQKRNIDQQKRMSVLQRNKNSQLLGQIQRIVNQKVFELSNNLDLSSFRKQINTHIQNKYKEIKLELSSQIRRESQSLITTELISIRRMISQMRFSSDNDGKGVQGIIQQYEEQKNHKNIETLKEEVQKLNNRLQSMMEQIISGKTNVSNQLKDIVNSFNKIKKINYISQSKSSQQPINDYDTNSDININNNNSTPISNSKISQIQSQIQQINSKQLQQVFRSEFEMQIKRIKQSISNFSLSASLITKQFQNNQQTHSMILKINSNVQHLQSSYELLKSTTLTKQQVQSKITNSIAPIQLKTDEIKQSLNKKIVGLQKFKSLTQNKQINQMTERINQLERLNNYEEYMEKVEAVLDKHHVEQIPNPKKTLYMDYINHLQSKVETVSKDLKSLHRKIEIESQGTRLMQVSKSDIQEVWKAIMILQTIIQSKSQSGSGKKKPWSTSDKIYDGSSSKNASPQKERGSETVYIRKTQTHRAGGFGQKVGSSKNIRHLLDQKPQRLQRQKKINTLIKLPQIPKQQ